MMQHLPSIVILCLLLTLNVECYKSHQSTFPCFVPQRSQCSIHSGHRHRGNASSSVMMAVSNKEKSNSPPADATRRMKNMNARLTKSRISSAGGEHNDARLMKTRMKEAELVEKLLFDAVNKMKRSNKQSQATTMPPSKLFPSVRQCNAALATFGDAGEFRRALRLFTQMKKSATLFSSMSTQARGKSTVQSTIGNQSTPVGDGDKKSTEQSTNNTPMIHSIDLVLDPPKPTLVTYSTLMSRAVSLGKPMVALRLWNLMCNQPNFYTNVISRKQRDGRSIAKKRQDSVELSMMKKEDEEVIIPDVIFCNTLMNAYAKLGEHGKARSILNAMLDSMGVPCHEGIPSTAPTVVTYNTLADACKVAGELGAALEVPELMMAHADATGDKSVLPDARTYTILISTVARKKKNDKEARDVRSGGENDPDMAFALLNRMTHEGIVPNGVTYCALIDVCSRCRRNDLALNGLRIMLKQKSKASLASRRRNVSIYHQQALFNEVGAWTAAINACGKTGRTDTAIRLFRTMQKLGVKPNSVTCGCLSDCLLKANPIRMTETLEVLQYMKKEGLVPGEVMYTSLMGIALTLAEEENKSVIRRDGLQVQIIDKFGGQSGTVSHDTEDDTKTSEAILLYTELMRCLIQDGDNDDMLLSVFLVFQEMRNAGASPDVACYNSLLRACARAGDIERSQDVLQRMNADGIEPNRNTWREALRAARRAKRSDFADTIWDTAVTSHKKDSIPFMPKVSDVELLLNVYVSELGSTNNHIERSVLNKKIMNLYEGIVSKSEERGFHYESLSIDEIEENQEFMLAVLRAAVSYELHGSTDDERRQARNLAAEIAGFEIFQRRLPQTVDRASKKALQLAQDWLYSY